MHGCGGIVFHMHGLARHLFPEQPFYGLKAQGLEKGQTPHTRIEDMATFYIKEIQTIQPEGPYIIGSSGDGGAIALEMAQQLKLQGQNVLLMILFNPVTLHPNPSHLSFIGDIYGGLSLALACSCLGFLCFNLPKAKIFLGDVGSVFLGFLFACLVVSLSENITDFLVLTGCLAPFYFDEMVLIYHLVENPDAQLKDLGVRLLRQQI